MTIVNGYGRKPNLVMLVGEAPGKSEAALGKPFVGRSGEEQEWYLNRHDLTSEVWYKTNVVKEYIPGNPDPSVEIIKEWSPVLEQEIRDCEPRVIVAVGRFAARWFLGDDVSMDEVHGIPHLYYYPHKTGGCVVVPIYHPAAGLYDTTMKAVIAWDYEQVANTVKAVKAGKTVDIRKDEFEGKEEYQDVSGQELADILPAHSLLSDYIAIDTEGYPDRPWSIQVSMHAGTGYTLRCDRDDFHVGIEAIRYTCFMPNKVVVMHNSMYDLEMCRVMGLDLFECKLADTMYAAYLLKLEPQGLKPLSYRWCGMKMGSHDDLINEYGRECQVKYLRRVLAQDFPKPEPMAVLNNDGTAKMYRPQSISRRAGKILDDIDIGKLDKDNNPVDPLKRWKAIDKVLRRPVEKLFGVMPIGSIADVYEKDPESAIFYASRDPDATLRLWLAIKDKLPYRPLFEKGMDILPVFEEMQSGGMPASRAAFKQLYSDMDIRARELQAEISYKYCEGRPFNPGSPKDVANLLKRRGLQAAETTATGEISTSKKSIEHLRYSDEAVGKVIDYREHTHIRDAFAAPILEILPDDEDWDGETDIYNVRCRIKPTRVHTRRLATSDPNLLAIPGRTEIGRRVRSCYRCGEGELLGAWDFSQIEARFMAHVSQDQLMIKLFNEDGDIHKETAARMWGVELDQVSKEQRTAAKTINYGVLYGVQGGGLSDQLRMQGIIKSDEECEGDIERWYGVYWGVRDYIEEVTREVKRTGVAVDHWGMIRHLPHIWSPNGHEREAAGREAVSHKIQGGAQGMIQNSIIWLKPIIRNLQKSGLNIKWVLTIHDEIIMRFDKELESMISPLVMEALTKHSGIELGVPVLASGNVANNWGDLK